MHLLHATNKVGLLPYRVTALSFPRKQESISAAQMDSCFRGNDNSPEFLLHLPRPKKAEEADQMKWGVARGTVRHRNAQGAWQDIRDAALLPSISPEAIEPHADAALHEAEEELGLRVADMQMAAWRDHGLMHYASETRGTYALHLFSVPVLPTVTLDALRHHAVDALNLEWFTWPQMREMIARDEMKAGYLPMVEAVLGSLAP